MMPSLGLGVLKTSCHTFSPGNEVAGKGFYVWSIEVCKIGVATMVYLKLWMDSHVGEAGVVFL